MKEEKEVSFESAMKKLETIVESLESGEISLEAALKQYEEGVRMADLCQKRLTEAQKKVEVLLKTSPGKFKTVPFEDSVDESQSKTRKKK
ncbi:MAG TPA: exodeoxyribonuclease VII small subunit [Candidatus Omnitrophota bacterium]|nr:exodeoxyribonuclease VII small subunit [Candidatus Omnitrophota bacterium]